MTNEENEWSTRAQGKNKVCSSCLIWKGRWWLCVLWEGCLNNQMRNLNKFAISESFSKFRLTSFGKQSFAFAIIQELWAWSFFLVMYRPNDRNMPTQHMATLLGATCYVRLATLLRHVGCCWLKFDHFQTWVNNTQHVATHRNTVAKRTQYVAPNNVAFACCDRLAGAWCFRDLVQG